ncbi:MAG: hypothetical protein ACKVN9_06210 [Methylophilaceae bacterium]
MCDKNRIAKYARDARAIGREKRVRVCAWLFRWGYCDRNIIALVGGDDVKFGWRLANEGLLFKVEHPNRKKAMYVLTQAGVDLAINSLLDLLDKRDASLDYPYLKDRRLTWDLTDHHNYVQEAMIRLGCHCAVGSDNWFSESELADGSSGAKPDGQININTSKVCIEVENGGKSDDSRKLQMWQRMEALSKGECTHIMWICITGKAFLAIKRELAKDVCVMVYKDKHSRMVVMPELGEPMAKLKAASTVIYLSDMDKDIVDRFFNKWKS